MKLDDQNYASLLDEVVDAIRNELPMVEAMDRLRDRRLGRIAKAAGQIADRLRAGESMADAISVISSPISGPVSAAMGKAVPRGGKKEGVGCDKNLSADQLQRLANRIRERSEATRVARLMWCYPIMLMGVGYLAILLTVVPMIQSNQFHPTQCPQGIHWPLWLSTSARILGESPWVLPIVAVVLIVIYHQAIRRRGGFVAPARIGLFCHTLADHLSNGVMESDAIRIAAAVSGHPVEVANPALDQPPVLPLLKQVGLSEEDPFGFPEETTVASLRYLGNSYQHLAKRQQLFWSVFVPQFVTLAFGLVFMTGYAWFVIGPIYREVAQW